MNFFKVLNFAKHCSQEVCGQMLILLMEQQGVLKNVIWTSTLGCTPELYYIY